MKFRSQHLIIAGIGIAMFFSQCGSENPSGTAHSALLQEKDSLRALKKEVSDRISAIEDELKLMDTTEKANIPTVTISQVQSGIFKHYFQVQGVVESDQNATINAETSAKVMSVSVKEGERVSKGQLLVKLDSRVLMNNIEELKTQIELATTIYEKQKSLWDQKIGSEIQYLETKTNKEGLERKLSTLYAQLEFYNIKSPFNGIVDEIFPKVGEMAMPGSPLLRVLNLSNVYLKADISEDYFGKIQVGDTAVISVNSAGVEIKSSINRIGNYINENNRTFKIRFDLDNKETKLIPNMLAVVKVQDYASADKKVIIPSKLLQQTPMGEEFVYVMHENGESRVQKVLVETGKSYQGQIEILSGLAPESMIIVEGARGIKDGELIEVTKRS